MKPNTEYLFYPHCQNLQRLLKSTKFWAKQSGPTQPYLIKGQLTNSVNGKECTYALTDKGNLLNLDKNLQCSLTDRIVILSCKPDGFEMQTKIKTKGFKCNELEVAKWVNLLVKFCVCRGLVNQRFQFVNQISQGNYSKGFVIEDGNKKQYICKTFNAQDLQRVSKLCDSAISEIIILRPLDHPNVIKLLEVHQDQNSLYIIYENIKSELFQRFKKRRKQMKSFTEQEVAHIMFQVMNIIHRDIKMENILFKEDNTLVIADFALSCITIPQFHYKKYGTPGYIAPEVLNMKTYTNKCDIFSAGAICYILLSEQPIFQGKTVQDILASNTAGQIHFDIPLLQTLSYQAMQFLQKTISIYEGLRPSADECLGLDFIRDIHVTIKQCQINNNRKLSLSYLESAIMPKSINLNRARKKSMRQYILLKQAVSAEEKQELQSLLQVPVGPQEEEEDRLIVTESVSNLSNSFYALLQQQNNNDPLSSSSSSDATSSVNSDDLVNEEEIFGDILSAKVRKLSNMVIKFKK